MTDVADAASVGSLIRQTVEAYGRLNVAVNNAGIAGGNMTLGEVSEELFDRVIATNLKACFSA